MAIKEEGGRSLDYILTDEELREEDEFIWKDEDGRDGAPLIAAQLLFLPYQSRDVMFAHYLHTVGLFERGTKEQRAAVYARIARDIPDDALRGLLERTDQMLKERRGTREARALGR